jgi:Ca-activated chloride channel family protein
MPQELARENEGLIDPLVYQPDRPVGGSNRTDLLTVKIRYKAPDGDRSSLISQPVRVGGESHVLPFAAAVAEFGMLLRAPEASGARWNGLMRRLNAMEIPTEDAADRQGFKELVELAAGLRRLK